MLSSEFFDRDTCEVSEALLGKVIRRRYQEHWLAAAIVETEAYYQTEKGSHASLGKSPSRTALFMPPGTIYMYYARGKDSFNISCRGDGNAVLIKGARPYVDERSPESSLAIMHALNPKGRTPRPVKKLCAGQTLLCQALAITVADWNAQAFDRDIFYIEDVGYRPKQIVQARRLGIPPGRDEHLMYRFIDGGHLASATSNPLTRRGAQESTDYIIKTETTRARP